MILELETKLLEEIDNGHGTAAEPDTLALRSRPSVCPTYYPQAELTDLVELLADGADAGQYHSRQTSWERKKLCKGRIKLGSKGVLTGLYFLPFARRLRSTEMTARHFNRNEWPRFVIKMWRADPRGR